MDLPIGWKSNKDPLKAFIEELSEINMKIAEPVKSGWFSTMFESSLARKRERAEIIKALNAKKCMVINAFPLPTNSETLLAFANLAYSCYTTVDNGNERKVWKNKMALAVNKLRNMVNGGQADEIADEFLFLSMEIEKLESEEEKKKKKSFF